jgi:heme O synthase-like polyprenyltransferase
MTLGWKLVLVFIAFCSLMGGVMWMAFRERKRGRSIAPGDVAAGEAQDSRVLLVIFSAAIGGLLLTLLVAWLVFL